MRSPFRDRTLQNVFPETESGRKSPKQAETVVKKKQPTPSPLHKTAAATTTKAVSEKSPLQHDLDVLVKEKQAKQKELQEARAKTSAMRKQLKEMETSIQRAKAQLKQLPVVEDEDDEEEERIKKRLQDLKADMEDNREMLQEFEDIIQQGGGNEKEQEEAEIVHLMNAIPEKLVYIERLKEKL